MKAQDPRTGRFVQVETTLDRFMSYVSPEPNTGCWIWAGTMSTRDQRGKFMLRAKESVSAATFSFETLVRPLLPGEIVRHRCDFPPCVNPAHLEPGSYSDNTTDSVKRGRWPAAKLDIERVREIRRRRAAGERRRVLAVEFGVSLPTIDAVVTRRYWAWVDEVPTGAERAGEG